MYHGVSIFTQKCPFLVMINVFSLGFVLFCFKPDFSQPIMKGFLNCFITGQVEILRTSFLICNKNLQLFFFFKKVNQMEAPVNKALKLKERGREREREETCTLERRNIWIESGGMMLYNRE